MQLHLTGIDQQIAIDPSNESCYREIEIEELRPGGKPRRVFYCQHIGGIMSGDRPCSDCISFGRHASDLNGSGGRAIVFRLFLTIGAAPRGPRSHAPRSWRANAPGHGDALDGPGHCRSPDL
jgi:hypothetical protein